MSEGITPTVTPWPSGTRDDAEFGGAVVRGASSAGAPPLAVPTREKPISEWVTIAEAAQVLGLSERQVRRYAGRLAEDDRLPPKSDRPEPDIQTENVRSMSGSSPVRVRLSALARAAGRPAVEENPTGSTSGASSEVSGSSPASTGHGVRPMSGPLSEEEARSEAWEQYLDTLKLEVCEAAEALQQQHDELLGVKKQLQEANERALEQERHSYQLQADKRVAEARADLLEKSIADTQAERDAWKEQAARDSERLGEALRALQQAQDETRAVRALSTRASVGLIEPQAAQNGPQGGDTVPEAPMEPPTKDRSFDTADTAQDGQKRGFWRRLVDSFSRGG